MTRASTMQGLMPVQAMIIPECHVVFDYSVSNMSTHIQARLLSIMQREMDMLGMSLPSSCRSQIEKMINRGVIRMRMNNLLDNPGMVLQAESNLKGLVRYFCDFSREVNTYPTLNDADFQKGLTACPTFFPYWSS